MSVVGITQELDMHNIYSQVTTQPNLVIGSLHREVLPGNADIVMSTGRDRT